MSCSKALALHGLLLLVVCPLIFSKASARELLHKTQGGGSSSSSSSKPKGNIYTGKGPAKPEYYYAPYYPPSGPSYNPPSSTYPGPYGGCSPYIYGCYPPTTDKSNDRHS